MKSRMMTLGSLCVFMAMSTGVVRADANDQPGSSLPAAVAPEAFSPEDLKAIRERMVKQQEQIEQLQQALAAQRALLEKVIGEANTKTSNSERKVEVGATPANTDVKLVPSVNAGPRNLAAGRSQNLQSSTPSPLSISIGESTFTPFGFVDFTWYGRSTNVGSGIGTNFGGIPFNNAAAEHL